MLQRVASKAIQALPLKLAQTMSKGANIELILKKYSEELAQSKAMESMIPRQFSEHELLKLSLNQRFTQGNNHIQSLNKTFSEPIWDLLDRGGKRWRPVLCMLIAELLSEADEKVVSPIAACLLCNYLNTFTKAKLHKGRGQDTSVRSVYWEERKCSD